MKEECKDFACWGGRGGIIWFCLVGSGFLVWFGFLRYWIFLPSDGIFLVKESCVYIEFVRARAKDQ